DERRLQSAGTDVESEHGGLRRAWLRPHQLEEGTDVRAVTACSHHHADPIEDGPLRRPDDRGRQSLRIEFDRVACETCAEAGIQWLASLRRATASRGAIDSSAIAMMRSTAPASSARDGGALRREAASR